MFFLLLAALTFILQQIIGLFIIIFIVLYNILNLLFRVVFILFLISIKYLLWTKIYFIKITKHLLLITILISKLTIFYLIKITKYLLLITILISKLAILYFIKINKHLIITKPIVIRYVSMLKVSMLKVFNKLTHFYHKISDFYKIKFYYIIISSRKYIHWVWEWLHVKFFQFIFFLKSIYLTRRYSITWLNFFDKIIAPLIFLSISMAVYLLLCFLFWVLYTIYNNTYVKPSNTSLGCDFFTNKDTTLNNHVKCLPDLININDNPNIIKDLTNTRVDLFDDESLHTDRMYRRVRDGNYLGRFSTSELLDYLIFALCVYCVAHFDDF